MEMPEQSNKIVDRVTLESAVAELKKESKRVVFTNGCFDILHAGHVRYLRQARELGDCLVVGLNSDGSAGRLKPQRPIVPEGERAEVLSAFEMVDYITIFDEDTPYDLIRAIRPDVLVKGGDWRVGEIVGADLVGEVYSLPYRRGFSTTGIIERITRRYCSSR